MQYYYTRLEQDPQQRWRAPGFSLWGMKRHCNTRRVLLYWNAQGSCTTANQAYQVPYCWCTAVPRALWCAGAWRRSASRVAIPPGSQRFAATPEALVPCQARRCFNAKPQTCQTWPKKMPCWWPVWVFRMFVEGGIDIGTNSDDEVRNGVGELAGVAEYSVVVWRSHRVACATTVRRVVQSKPQDQTCVGDR